MLYVKSLKTLRQYYIHIAAVIPSVTWIILYSGINAFLFGKLLLVYQFFNQNSIAAKAGLRHKCLRLRVKSDEQIS